MKRGGERGRERRRGIINERCEALKNQWSIVTEINQEAKAPFDAGDYAKALELLLKAHAVVEKLIESPLMKLDSTHLLGLYDGIALCAFELGKLDLLKKIAPISCRVGVTSGINAVCHSLYQQGKLKEAYELLNIVYKSKMRFQDCGSVVLFAILIQDGQGTYKKTDRYDLVHKLLTSVPENENKDASLRLARFYYRCPDLRYRSLHKAIKIYTAIIESHQDLAPTALLELSVLYETGGDNLPPDPKMSFDLMTRSAQQGNTDAMVSLACSMMASNSGADYNPQKAEEYLRRAADAKNPRGFHWLAIYIYQQRIPSKSRVDDALSLCLQGANLGEVYCMFNYAVLKSSLSSQYDPEVVKWYKAAAEKNSVDAQYNLILYLSKILKSTIVNEQNSEKLISMIFFYLDKLSLSKDPILSVFGKKLRSKINKTDKSKTAIIDVIIDNKHKEISPLEQEIEDISSEKRVSRKYRISSILSRVRNLNWLDKNNIASAVYHIAQIFNENSSARAPFEKNSQQIGNIIRFVNLHVNEFEPEALVNIFIGISKLHIHPENELMSECLDKLLPKIQDDLLESLLLKKRKILYAVTRFLLNTQHKKASDFCRKLYGSVMHYEAFNLMDMVQLTECAYFVTIYHHCVTIDPIKLKKVLVAICRCVEDLGPCQMMDDRTAHQWFMINALFKEVSGTPLAFIERTLQHKWHNMSYEIKSSQFEDEVADSLSRLGIRFERQKIVNAIPVDFYLTDYDVVLEANGPSHYLYGYGEPTLTPRDIARNKLVGAQLKSPVLIVSYFEWSIWREEETCDHQLLSLVKPQVNSINTLRMELSNNCD